MATPPLEFGNYELKNELGHGASGRVFECKKKDCPTLYAVKVLHLRSLRLSRTAERDLTRLSRELKILKELPPHPRIVQMVDSFEEGDWFFLILELVRGGDLFHALMERRPTRLLEREAAFVFWQLVDGISFLHNRNIIHRDLKLENVLISDKHREGKLTMYNVKISDFGLSKAVTGSLPQIHSMVGTQRYVAPEVLHRGEATSRAYDFRVDLWSLGVLTFLLLTGGYPNTASQEALQEAIAKISSESAQLILKGLLQLDPVQRFTLKDLQSRSWQTGDEDVILLPPTFPAAGPGAPMAPSPNSESTPCSGDFEVMIPPPAPLHSLNDPSLLSGIHVEPEPEPGQQRAERTPSILPTMSFLAGMEEELRRPPRPFDGALRRMLSDEQLSRGSGLQLSHARAAAAGPSELHLHFLVPSTCAGAVDESTLKELKAKSGCNVWTTPAEGPNDACHVVIVGTCSQCTVAQKMLVDVLQKDAPKDFPQNRFTVVMFWRSDVCLSVEEMDNLQRRSSATVELLPKEQEGKRPWIITGESLVQVLEAERLMDSHINGERRPRSPKAPKRIALKDNLPDAQGTSGGQPSKRCR